ncbi:MAG: DUF1553 domain-containing protein [Planctomycetales bacterium]|nr:DUF1553 domain-containing protein [Planctomycetales bacterium]
MKYTAILLVSAAWLVNNALAQPPASSNIQVFPASLSLTGPQASGRVVVQQQQDGQTAAQITQGLRLTTVDPQVAAVRQGRVWATGDGQTELSVWLSEQEVARIPVTVRGSGQELQPQFEAHVQAILAKRGCNSGACHGALAGKGGFRLSLHGYDSQADHFAITRQDRGRRIEPAAPGRSLLLAKPSTLLPHKGGLRLAADSEDYRRLAAWIAAGAPGPRSTQAGKDTAASEEAATELAPLVRLEVLPAQVRLSLADKQQLIVRAHYGDGRIEDVTHWAKFTAVNERVAEVDDHGQVNIVGPGKGAVSVWFASRIALAAVVVPFAHEVDESAYADFEPANLIDEILLEEWRALGLAPSPSCNDTTFLRRVWLDSSGRLPTPAQIADFLQQPQEQRRGRLIDEVLGSSAFVNYWAYQWSDLLLVNGNLLRPAGVAAFYTWIREQVQANTPWDQFARQIILAQGESEVQGATNFYALHQDPESLTENTCQAFMGLSLGCAKCHNHPLEKWTNDQYYAMANLYARVRAKGWGGDARSGDGRRTLFVLERGDLIQPSRGVPQPPAALDAQPIPIDSPLDRRLALADWLTSDQNRYFSRAIVNRVWANYLGVGLVEPIDDLRTSNPASSERLLDALADYLIEHDYDLRALMRLILNSQTYQRSAMATPANAADDRFYCRYYPRRLMAEVLLDAVVQVTGVPSEFKEIEFAGADKRPTEFYPAGTSALQLYDSAVVNYFLQTFGRHQRRITCSCERSDQPTVVQALHLNNGDTLNDKLSDPRAVLNRWLEDQNTASEVIEQAYLRALSRLPTAAEQERLLQLILAADAAEVARLETYQDLLWSLMTSREFLFAH